MLLEDVDSGAAAKHGRRVPSLERQDPEALIEEARRWERRRRYKRAGFGLGVIAALMLAFGIGWSSIAGGPSKVQQIEANLATSLGRSSAFVLYTRTHSAERQRQFSQTWTDLATGAWRDSARGVGLVVTSNSYRPMRDSPLYSQRQITLWYQSHAWVLQTFRSQQLPPAENRCDCNPLANNADPRTISAVGRVHVTFIGEQKVDGQHAYRLRFAWTTRPPKARPNSGWRPRIVDLWINRSTNLPIRLARLSPTRHIASTADYQWLPRTQQNLALTRLTIPAGFKRTT